ncbi:hypothetical protein GCM10008967_17090 [Bacillus carboniphilus]|uniref:DUF4367 domain-containing protein n=1 Tax=Bacillus carboniphilus TaxID=86663 RepID=A0ABP3FYU3_9BACI
MKKLWMFIIIALTLTACGATEENLSKEDVFNRAIEASETVKSYTLEMDMDIDMMDMKSNLKATGDVTHNPDSMMIKMSMGMPGMSMDFDAYVRDGEAYVSMFGEWMKMSPEEMGLEDFDQLNKEELEKMKQFKDQFEMKEEGNVYILTLSGEGDEFGILVEDLLESSMGPADPEMEESVESMKVNKLDIEMQINKESFIPTTQNIKADVEIVEQGTTTPVKLNGTISMTNINNVDPIEIPDEVKENAISEEDLFGTGMSLEEIRETVAYEVPEVTQLPEGFSLVDSMYDDMMNMVMLSYEKDMDNGFMSTVYPAEEEMALDEMGGEPITIQGKEAYLFEEEEFFSISWENNGLYIELAGGGPDIKREQMIQIAESVQ